MHCDHGRRCRRKRDWKGRCPLEWRDLTSDRREWLEENGRRIYSRLRGECSERLDRCIVHSLSTDHLYYLQWNNKLRCFFRRTKATLASPVASWRVSLSTMASSFSLTNWLLTTKRYGVPWMDIERKTSLSWTLSIRLCQRIHRLIFLTLAGEESSREMTLHRPFSFLSTQILERSLME